jgi:hypothetical protein
MILLGAIPLGRNCPVLAIALDRRHDGQAPVALTRLTCFWDYSGVEAVGAILLNELRRPYSGPRLDRIPRRD